MLALPRELALAGAKLGEGDIPGAGDVLFGVDLRRAHVEEERRLLLRFTTSASRAPLLGFKSMKPPFTLFRVHAAKDSRLPSASTCFNTLKLPSYASKQQTRDRIITAITGAGGFDEGALAE